MGIWTLGLFHPFGLLTYLTYADDSKSIEVDIDLSLIDPYSQIAKFKRKEKLAAFKKIEKAGLLEILQSSNWKHHKVLIHPVEKVLEERSKK